jgi:ethanolamine utilization protein EutA
MTPGQLLTGELGVAADILVVDGISLRDFDYIDIGRVRFPLNPCR